VPHQGINPTRRLVLAVLKYGLPYSRFLKESKVKNPPKCYYDSEEKYVDDALSVFAKHDIKKFKSMGIKENKNAASPEPQYMTLDASLMELADDIAYAVHDLEDIVARGLIKHERMEAELSEWFPDSRIVGLDESEWNRTTFLSALFSDWSGERKQTISRLVNMFISQVLVEKRNPFEDPLLSHQATLPPEHLSFLKNLKLLTYEEVVKRANVQQLEARGARIVRLIFEELSTSPAELIPQAAWNDLDNKDSNERRVCDYVAGMTDGYAEKIYNRLFTPGYGSSHDEL
jgi:dGTPase